MCTVSIVPRDAGFRLVCNRDERLDRPVADPPRVRRLGRLMTISPMDPVSAGTWIGANEHGLAAALLNRNAGSVAVRKVAPHSRGTIIPRLLGAGDLPLLVRRAARLTPEDYSPFTLLILQGQVIAVITSTGSRLALSIANLTRPVMFTSSSLGDSLVDRPRRALFERLVGRCARPLEGQSRYHAHRWAARPAMSVVMSRPGAATVSRTAIDVNAGTVSMRHEVIRSDEGGRRTENGRRADGERTEDGRL